MLSLPESLAILIACNSIPPGPYLLANSRAYRTYPMLVYGMRRLARGIIDSLMTCSLG